MQRGRTARIFPPNQLGAGGDLLLDLIAISGAYRGDERHDFGIHRLAWRLCDDVGAELRALIYPGSQQPDFFVRERARWRHLQPAVAVHQTADQLAGAAGADFDDRTVIAAAQRVLAQIQPQAGLLNLRPMAGVTIL